MAEQTSAKETPPQITPENAAVYTAFYAVQTYKRLGYLIKLLEQKTKGGV